MGLKKTTVRDKGEKKKRVYRCWGTKEVKKKKSTWESAVTQMSCSGPKGVGRGSINLLFQMGESNHLISSNCNDSVSSGGEGCGFGNQGANGKEADFRKSLDELLDGEMM